MKNKKIIAILLGLVALAASSTTIIGCGESSSGGSQSTGGQGGSSSSSESDEQQISFSVENGTVTTIENVGYGSEKVDEITLPKMQMLYILH